MLLQWVDRGPCSGCGYLRFRDGSCIHGGCPCSDFKEKKDDEFVGGLPFYGRKLLGNKVWIGVFLSVLYILYALCCLPAQGFNVVSSVGRMAEIVTGKPFQADQPSII